MPKSPRFAVAFEGRPGYEMPHESLRFDRITRVGRCVLVARPRRDYIPRVFTNATGSTIPYRLLMPKNYDAKKTYPLVIFLHGAGERGTNNTDQLKHGTSLFAQPENREKFPCFVFAPQCPKNQFWALPPSLFGPNTPPSGNAMPLALGALADLQKKFSVDPQRLYLTGLSMGGFGTWDCIIRFPKRFAAGAPICGGADVKGITSSVAKVPVWAFHSFDDNAVKVKFTRDLIAAMRAAHGMPKYFEYFGAGHASWNNAYAEPEFLQWMFAQRLGKPDTYVLKTKAPELPAVLRFPEASAFPGKGPLRTTDWFREVLCERRGKFWLDRERDRGAVVFLGDSITQGWEKRLQKEFPNIKTANRGISGDVTRGVLYRLKEDVLDLDPKAVVLLIGTNDLEENADPSIIAGNIKLILEACKMPVVVCKVMPSDTSKNRPSYKIQRLNTLVDDIVKTNPRFIRCDTYSIFADAAGNAKPAEFPDLLHPNADGYTKFAAALRPILDGLK